MSIHWIPDNQTNGRGWMSRCGNYAIRECVYRDGTPTDYWCYYKVKVGDSKFMPVCEGVHLKLEDAVRHCEDLNKCKVVTHEIKQLYS